MLAGFKDDLQAKHQERQELHTKLQKLQVKHKSIQILSLLSTNNILKQLFMRVV